MKELAQEEEQLCRKEIEQLEVSLLTYSGKHTIVLSYVL